MKVTSMDTPQRYPQPQMDLDRIEGDNSSTIAPADSYNTVDYPEGGTEAWLVVLAAFCALFLVFGVVNTTAVFQEYLSSHQLRDEPPTRIAWIFSVNLFITFFCGIWSGSFFDHHGPRLLVAFGSVFLTLSMMLLGLCQNYWQFMLVYGILGGVGGALLMTPAFASIGHFFFSRRGLATGIANTSGSMGGIIIPLMLQRLNAEVGFAWATRIVGFVFLTLAIPTNIFLKGRLAPKRSASIWPDLRVLKVPSFAMCCAGMFLMEWGLFVVLAYIASSTTADGSTAKLLSGYSIVALLNTGSFFGRWIPGLLADRYGRFNVILVTIALCALTIFAFWLPSRESRALVIVFALTFGFASGSNLALIPVCLSQLCSSEAYGRYLSTAYFITSFGTLTSVPLGGSLLVAMKGRYTALIIFAGAAYTGALFLYGVSRSMAVGMKLNKKF